MRRSGESRSSERRVSDSWKKRDRRTSRNWSVFAIFSSISVGRSRRHIVVVVVVVQIHELEAKELKLKSLSESEERTKRMQHLQTGRVKSDLQSVKKKLNRERDLKMDAFHKVEDLQAQVKC